MNLAEYKNGGYFRYGLFAAVVANLIEKAIRAEGGYRLQHIPHRAKTIESLSQRLEEIGELGNQRIESVRKDLGGCRILFYSDDDVDRFVRSNLLQELFDVDPSRSKIHYPGRQLKSVNDLFQSHNFVVKLKAERAELVEYREFKDLLCEVQVQTILVHAWAEFAHDVYKESETLSPLMTENVGNKLKEVMEKFLLPAGHYLSNISIQSRRFRLGKVLLDEGILDAVIDAKDNNERYEAVRHLKDDVLPYCDDFEELVPQVRRRLKEGWLRTLEVEKVSRQAPFGDFEGYEVFQVTGQIVEIMELCRYVDVIETYRFVFDLYGQTSNPEARGQLLDLIRKLAAYSLDIWKQIGPELQVTLAGLLSKEKDFSSVGPVVLAMAEEMLVLEARGTTWSSDKVTLRSATLVLCDGLYEVRRATLNVLFAYAENDFGDDEALGKIIDLFFDLGRWPRDGVNSGLVALIHSDLVYVLEFLVRNVSQMSLSIRQKVENRLWHCWRSNCVLPSYLDPSQNEIEVHERLARSVADLRKILNDDEEFVIFKTLVGYESVFPHHWDEGYSFDFEKDEEIRKEQQSELVRGISEDGWLIWKRRVSDAAHAVKSGDLAMFPPFTYFLSVVSEKRPSFGLVLLSDRDSLPDWTIRPIAGSLLTGELSEDAKEVLQQWLDEGRFIQAIADLVVWEHGIGDSLILKVVRQALERKDGVACAVIASGATRRYVENMELWKNQAFLPCLEVLREVENFNWVFWSSSYVDDESLFHTLSSSQRIKVLEAMLRVPVVDYRVERILKCIAVADPELVLNWFGQRIKIGEDKLGTGFEPIPFSFQSLHGLLQAYPEKILEEMRKWYKRDTGFNRWHIYHFLGHVYPNFENSLDDVLLTAVEKAKDKDELLFFALCLVGFQGKMKVFPILRAVIRSDFIDFNQADEKIMSVVSSTMSGTEITRGLYGQVEAYEEKVRILKPWLDDEDVKVRCFAKRMIHKFEQTVAARNRGIAGDVARRKLEYDESLDWSSEEV